MKVLKSGVEMTPEEMTKSRGGMCACGCGVGRDADGPWVSSDNGTLCSCSCEPGEPINSQSTKNSALKYLYY